jgi:hypothetical protein
MNKITSKKSSDIGAWTSFGCVTIIALIALFGTALFYIAVTYVGLHFINKWW